MPVYVTVTDVERHLVADLIKDDFDVLDNGKPVPIVLFDAEVQPISVVTMLDTSGSMTGSLDLLKAAAEQFLIRLLPHDRGMVGAFNDKIQFVSPLTSDRDDLVSSLQDIGFGNPTRLFDAIDASLEQLKPIEGRRVVLIFTDGEDTFSKIGSGTVLDRARTDEVMIYSIGLQSVYFNGQRQVRTQPDRILKKLSDETGGGLLRVEADRRSGSDLHARRPGAAQPVLTGVRTCSGRQSAQAGSRGQAARSDRPGPAQLSGAWRQGHTIAGTRRNAFTVHSLRDRVVLGCRASEAGRARRGRQRRARARATGQSPVLHCLKTSNQSDSLRDLHIG